MGAFFGAFLGCCLIAGVMCLIGHELRRIGDMLEARQKVDSERCKCQICDGQVPTMKERRDG